MIKLNFLIFSILIVVLLLILTKLNFVFANQKDFNNGKNFSTIENQMKLGNPDELENDLLKHKENISHLSNLDDNSLSQARPENDALKLENGEDLLLNSENSKIEHPIDKREKFFENSSKIESDPLAYMNMKQVSGKKTIKTEILKKCIEGVNFELNIERRLNYIPPPRIREKRCNGHSKNWPLQECDNLNEGLIEKNGIYDKEKPYLQSWSDNVKAGYKTKNTFLRFSTSFKWYSSSGTASWTHINNTQTCDNFNMVELPRREQDGKEGWDIATPNQEIILEKNNCYETARICTLSGTRNFDGINVNRPCWQERITYVCKSDPLDGCEYLKKRGCDLKSSLCIEGNPCLKWERTYDCSETRIIDTEDLTGGELFCLSGDCHKPDPEQNNDMNEAVVNLAVIQAMKKDMGNMNPPTIFKGEKNHCERYITNFCDCCADLDGWGKTIGLTRCSTGEKSLAEKRKKGLCYFVGSYVPTKVLGFEVTKRRAYCCFSTKLARLLHEQGRSQIGKNWGSSENPDCGPLTISEIAMMKFDQMNFSEIFDELFKDVSTKAQKAFPNQMQNQMPTMQENINKGNGGGNVNQQSF